MCVLGGLVGWTKDTKGGLSQAERVLRVGGT